jgi:hypothetical protein
MIKVNIIIKISIKYYVFMYENGAMRPAETSLRREVIKEKDGGVNLTKICCNHYCKCHNVPKCNYNMLIHFKIKSSPQFRKTKTNKQTKEISIHKHTQGCLGGRMHFRCSVQTKRLRKREVGSVALVNTECCLLSFFLPPYFFCPD